MTRQTARPDSAGSPPSLPEDRPTARTRLACFDNLRTVLITMVVLGHLAVTYGADADWYYYESGEVNLLAYALIMMAAIGIILVFARSSRRAAATASEGPQ